jgi:hypothetical protein
MAHMIGLLAAALAQLSALAAPDAGPAPEAISCPMTISVKETAGDVPGWTIVGEDGERYVDRVSIFFGPPAGKGSLVPDSTRRRGRQESDTWTFQPAAKEEHWLVCHYLDTRMVVARKLGEGTRRCVVTYDLTPSRTRLPPKHIACE